MPPIPVPDDAGIAALRRLLDLACGDTGQSATAANFPFAWWNANACGGWDLADFWAVDDTVAADTLAVTAFIAANRIYPDNYGLKEEFEALVTQWRPHLCSGPV